jgi:transposase
MFKRPDYTRGIQIRRILRFYWALQSPQSAREISKITGMGVRQVYRWLNVAVEEGIAVAVGCSPKKYHLLPSPEITSGACESLHAGVKEQNVVILQKKQTL